MNDNRLHQLEKKVIADMLGLSVWDVDVTTDGFTLKRYDLTSQLRCLANRDYEAYKREIYADRAAQYRQQTEAKPYMVAGLFQQFDEFRKWLKSGEQAVPADYADFGSFQLKRDYNGTTKKEWMVMLPARLFGLPVVISLDTLIDLLRLLKQQKIPFVAVRAVPITPRIHPTSKSYIEETYHWSALEIQNGRDVYQLFSDTKPEFEVKSPFALYDAPALPAGDAGCFPAAAPRAMAIVPYAAPIAVCDLCHAVTQVSSTEGRQLCADCAAKVSAYAGRFEARLDRMRARAAKAQTEYAALNAQAKKMAEVIPFGQPILIGHHSEKADRRYRDRIHSTFGRAFAHFERAKELRQRADAAEANHMISSDDPLAVVKLREKLADLESTQTFMKTVNATIRKHAQAGQDAQVKALAVLGLDEKQALRLLQPDDLRRVGYPDYRLTNNGAEIRRVKARIEELLKKAEAAARMEKTSSEQHGDIRLERDYDANRIRLHFPGKPTAAVIKALKHHGFVWSPANTAWQRQLNNAGEYAATCIIKRVIPMPQRFQPGQSVKVLPNDRQPGNVGLVGVIEYAQRYDNGDVEYRVQFSDFGDYVNDWELALADE